MTTWRMPVARRRRHEVNHVECEMEIPRRKFLRLAGVVVVGSGVGSCKPSSETGEDGIPASRGYILVDTRKCQGCLSCMLACSLVHEGEVNLSLSRVQVMQNSFEKWPDDLTIEQCRQCADPVCLKACPTGALGADAKYGNVRIVNVDKCIGCGLCMEACPYTPSRLLLAPDKDFNNDPKSRKCDLCAYAQYHWHGEGGGPNGKQACLEVCPVGAIKFTERMPAQKGEAGYKVDLRGRSWKRLGYPAS
ncbi:MAG: 4Fe-4S dicluster domain-containing protein [Planctomycetota bacterium]